MSLMVEQGFDLRSTHLHLQGDNASKELKNNAVLMWAASQVGLRRLQQCTVSFLSSGHSHEDVDAVFSNMSTWLNRAPELLTPNAFRTSLEGFLNEEGTRPHEPLKRATIMSRFRDWKLWLI